MINGHDTSPLPDAQEFPKQFENPLEKLSIIYPQSDPWDLFPWQSKTLTTMLFPNWGNAPISLGCKINLFSIRNEKNKGV